MVERTDAAEETRGLEPALDRVRAFLGAEIAELSSVSPLRPTRDPRRSFRLVTGDGRSFKLRRLRSVDHAERVARLLGEFDDPRLARVLLRHEDVLLEEWVEGTPVGDAPSADVARQAGALLAELHRREAGTAPVAPHLTTIDEQLDALVDAGALLRAEADRLRTVASADAPGDAPVGLVHLDLCGANMLVDTAGGVHVIDNEWLKVDHLGYDLARTLYRWPLAPDLRAEFLAGYGARHPIDAAPLWRIRAVVVSAYFRVTSGAGQAEAALEALRLMAGEAAAR